MTETRRQMPLTSEDALAQFRRWAADAHLVTLDTETTGLDGDVVELALTDLTEQPLLDVQVRPTTPFTEKAVEMHGIHPEHVAHLPLIGAHSEALAVVLVGRTVVAYGAEFDLKRVVQSFDHAQPDWRTSTSLEELLVNWGCVRDAYADYAAVPDAKGRGNRWFSLADACKREGVETEDLTLHRAMSDARLTARLIRKLGRVST